MHEKTKYSVKQLHVLYNNDVVYRCSKSYQLIIAQCNIHRDLWSSSSDMLLHSHSSDRYDIQVNECVTTHTRPQVDVITCTFLVPKSFLCSTGTAALRRHTAFSATTPSLSTSSGVSLSFLSLYCFLLRRIHSSICIQHEQWTPPSINQLICAEKVIYSDNSPWHKPLHIPNMASGNLCRLLIHDMNHYTYRIWQSSNLHC